MHSAEIDRLAAIFYEVNFGPMLYLWSKAWYSSYKNGAIRDLQDLYSEKAKPKYLKKEGNWLLQMISNNSYSARLHSRCLKVKFFNATGTNSLKRELADTNNLCHVINGIRKSICIISRCVTQRPEMEKQYVASPLACRNWKASLGFSTNLLTLNIAPNVSVLLQTVTI